MDAVQAANSGHPGMPMGFADVATVLATDFLSFDSADPEWADRDRLILSAGHGSMLLYALLHLAGYRDVSLNELKNFRQLGSRTAGHPEYGHAHGIETTTGPLGQGLANAVGFAIAEEILREQFGPDIVNHATYVIAGDGCLMEGVSQESITLAGHLQLGKLILLWDCNDVTIDGELSLSDRTDQELRFKSAGWSVFSCDGHDPTDIRSAIGDAVESEEPSLVVCKTQIGFGSPNKGGTAAAHGSPLGPEEIALVRDIYDWPHAPFVIPDDIREAWRRVGTARAGRRKEWQSRIDLLSARRRREFKRRLSGELPYNLAKRIRQVRRKAAETQPKIATRKASEIVLQEVNPILTEAVGGSADLTGSNNTRTPELGVFSSVNRGGRYLHYGIREHAMAAAMNGMALHGGIRPYGGTFLCFADYARPAMRLSSLMNLPVIYVMTHDSIGLGEDGPTHQPVEHLAMLRATPGLEVFRPCDLIETAEAWELALSARSNPTVIALSRQALPTARTSHSVRNLSIRGGYVLAPENSKRRVSLLATGSEVSIAIEAKRLLESKGFGTRVVSLPCWERFERQSPAFRKRTLGGNAVRIGIEAAARTGWDRWLCSDGGSSKRSSFVGMSGFGVSAPCQDAFDHFRITAARVVEEALELL